MKHSRFLEILDRVQAGSDLAAKDSSVERVGRAIAARGIKPAPERMIVVGGTNGKGSTAKTLETLLAATGVSVGLFTSPHMISATERIRSHGCDLTEQEFIDAYYLLENEIREFELARFEAFTLMMAEVFWGGRLRKPVDWAVLEIGVGGRQDPVRAVPHATSVFAQIGFDHEALLGSTLAQITREKLGAVDHGNLVVHAPFPAEAGEIVREARGSLGGRWVEAPGFPSHVVYDDSHPCWMVDSPWGSARLALLGERAVFNTSLALVTAAELGLPVRELLPSLSRVEWPCRMERFEIARQTVYLSGDHNPQGVESLRELLSHFRYRKVHLLVGVGKNKNMPAMLEAFGRIPRSEIHLTVTPFRSSSVEDLSEYRDRVASVCGDAVEALNRILSLKSDLTSCDHAGERVEDTAEVERLPSSSDLVVVTGSLYLAGHLRGEILQGRFGEWTKATT